MCKPEVELKRLVCLCLSLLLGSSVVRNFRSEAKVSPFGNVYGEKSADLPSSHKNTP